MREEVLPGGCIEEFGALDDDQVGRGIDAPCERGSGHQDADLAVHKQPLHAGAVVLVQTRVVEPDPKAEGVSQV